jgi:hypothetical protein
MAGYFHKRRLRGIFVENQIIESASSVGAALGGRAEYAAPDGAGFVLEWRRYKDSAPTVLCFL